MQRTNQADSAKENANPPNAPQLLTEKPELFPFDLDAVQAGQKVPCLSDGTALVLQDILSGVNPYFSLTFTDSKGYIHHASVEGDKTDASGKVWREIWCRDAPKSMLNGVAIDPPYTDKVNSEDYWFIHGERVIYKVWENTSVDYARMQAGQCFASKEAALAWRTAVRSGNKPLPVQIYLHGPYLVVVSDVELDVRLAWPKEDFKEGASESQNEESPFNGDTHFYLVKRAQMIAVEHTKQQDGVTVAKKNTLKPNEENSGSEAKQSFQSDPKKLSQNGNNESDSLSENLIEEKTPEELGRNSLPDAYPEDLSDFFTKSDEEVPGLTAEELERHLSEVEEKPDLPFDSDDFDK